MKNNIHLSKEHKKKISTALKGIPNPKESETKKRLFAEGKLVVSQEQKIKHSQYMKKLYVEGFAPRLGKHISQESKEKISKRFKQDYVDGIRFPFWKGKPKSEEHRKRIGIANKQGYIEGRHIPYWKVNIMSKEHRRKIGLANKGHCHTEETKQKIRAARLKQVLPFKDTSIELKIQNGLKEKGITFEKHKYLRGQPDLFIAPNICIFADGCYWHKCESCGFGNGKERDKEVTDALRKQGFIVLRFWEHDINDNLDFCINKILELNRTCDIND